MFKEKKIITYKFGDIIFSDFPAEYRRGEIENTLDEELPLPYKHMVFESEADFLKATQNLLNIHAINVKKSSRRNINNWILSDSVKNNLKKDLVSSIGNFEESDIKTEFRFGDSSRIELFTFNEKTDVILSISIEARCKVSIQKVDIFNDVVKKSTEEYTTRWVDSERPLKITVCYEKNYQEVYSFE
jgi:hypothetical protein